MSKSLEQDPNEGTEIIYQGSVTAKGPQPVNKVKRDKNERQSSTGKKDQKVVTNIITNNNINNFIINNPKIEVNASGNPG